VTRDRLRRFVSALVLFALTGSSASVFASPFQDPEDGAFDLSEWLLERKGFIVAPIVITEPAVGYGGGAAVAFFRQSLRDVQAQGVQGRAAPPDVFGAAAAATENGTQFQGVGASFSFGADRVRYNGALGKARVNLTLHELAPGPTDELAYETSLDGWASSQEGKLRVAGSRHFVGLRWIWLDLDATTAPTAPGGVAPTFDSSETSSGLGPVWEYDSRDNTITPGRGVSTRAEATFYAPALGGEDEFRMYRARVYGWVPVDSSLVIGLRADGRMADGDVPFYQYPYIELRGIPAARYQGEKTGVLETELRYGVTRRWSVLGFVGAGWAWGFGTDLEDARARVAGGGGFRYLLARRLHMHAGIDVGVGPEETAIYLTMGSAWN